MAFFLRASGPANDSVYARATADLTLTNVAQDVPGATVQLLKAGRWLVIACFDFTQATAGDLLTGQLWNDAGQVSIDGFTPVCHQSGPVETFPSGTHVQSWIYTAAVGDNLRLRGLRSSGAGAAHTINSVHTRITAVYLGL